MYFTSHYMTVHNVKNSNDFKRLEEYLDTHTDLINNIFKPGKYNGNTERAKYSSCISSTWYNNRICIEEISEIFPDFIFFIVGIGESATDIWRLVAKNGISEFHQADITFNTPTIIDSAELYNIGYFSSDEFDF